MTGSLSDTTIHLVKATVPALQEHGLAITQRMYERMFHNPDIRDLFNQSHHGETGSQPRALAAAVLAYAQNIDNLGALAPAVERIAQKHVGLNILPEHYPHVAEALLGAIKDVLGAAATDESHTKFVQIDAGLRLVERQDRAGLSLDPVRTLIAAHGLGRDMTLPSELTAPAAGTRQAHLQALCRLVPGRAGLDGMDHALSQIDGQGLRT